MRSTSCSEQPDGHHPGMSAADRRRLRTVFEDVPELYDRARPTYPAAVFDGLEELAKLAPGARVLEIGCGTGQASAELASRGFRLLCVELGPSLARLARANLSAFRDVEVVNAAFETWDAEGRRFDAVVAFSAFHWLDPEAAYAKAATVLDPGAALAIVSTQHVQRPGGDRFWTDVQEDYDAVVPSDQNRPPPPPDEVPDELAEMEASGCFRAVGARRYIWDVEYTADSYVDVLETYSGHRDFDRATRDELYDRIRRRIDGHPGGRVTKTYVSILNVAARA